MKAPYRVILIVDRSYGDKLTKFTSEDPIWIVATTDNMPIVREQWSLQQNRTHLDGVTSFNDAPDLSPDELAESIIDTIELHHGAYSHDPPMTILEIIGSPKTAKLVLKLAELGFSLTTEESERLLFERRS